ncbi:MAG: ABC transporter permease [Bacteroidota bacterium]
MFRNHFKLTFRNLLRNKSQSAILIGGLTAGMAACILLLQYVSFELSFDDFHTKKENIYRVVNERIQNGEMVQKGTITYPTIGPTMLDEFPEVKNATRIGYSSDMMITKDGKVKPVGTGLWVDEHFLEIFDFELLASEGLQILDEPNEIVLPRFLADRYYPMAKGNYERILGEELQIDRYDGTYKIVGICENVPANSLLEFEMLLSYASAVKYWGEEAGNSWRWSDFYHYLELEEGTDVAELEAKFVDFSERHFRGAEVSGSEELFTLQPLSEAHLYSADLEYEIGRTANGRAVWSLLIIAFFILVIAWINYVNLSSVRAIERAKEVGVRKVIGATRGQLVRQFFTEAMVVNFVSLILALGVVQLLNPWFAVNFDIDVNALSFFTGNQVNLYLIGALLALIMAGVVVSGAYPAWLLSSPHVSSVLKGVFTKDLGGGGLRKGLVVFQFTMSIALITATWLVSQQISFMSKQDLGVDITQVMTINSPEMTSWDSTFIERMDAFKAELTKFPGVNSAATSNRAPGQRMGRIFNIQKIGEGELDQSFTSNFITADFEYAKTYNMEPLAGRYFRQSDHHVDWEAVDKLVITAEAVKMLGYTDNETAIGQRVRFWDKDWTVVGVMPDFHQRSLHHGIEPIVFLPSYSTYNLLSLNVNPGNIDQTIAQVQATYENFFPGNSFDYNFVNDDFQRLYAADQRFGNILSFFTLLTILVACLGLFGLASYTTFLRTKEIGVRKVLGASSASIVALLSKDFLKLVFVSLVIAAPLAWYVMQIWLQEFAYRIDIAWWVFALAGAVAILVAFFTVSFQSVKAALANPVDSLKTE